MRDSSCIARARARAPGHPRYEPDRAIGTSPGSLLRDESSEPNLHEFSHEFFRIAPRFIQKTLFPPRTQDRLARGCGLIPVQIVEMNGTVTSTVGDAAAIGRKRHGLHPPNPFLKDVFLLSHGNIVEPDLLIHARTDERSAIRRKCQRVDAPFTGCKLAAVGPGLKVPQFERSRSLSELGYCDRVTISSEREDLDVA